jgi:hypothetical protein
MAMKTQRPNRTIQAWIDARQRHGLSHALDSGWIVREMLSGVCADDQICSRDFEANVGLKNQGGYGPKPQPPDLSWLRGGALATACKPAFDFRWEITL